MTKIESAPEGTARGRVEEIDATIQRCFADLDVPLLLAVSGGLDSMALMRMAARWAGTLAAPPSLHVATVDHGLRPAAADEARFVAEAAAALGLPYATLTWRGAKLATRIQERARAARYALLAEHARAIGAGHIVTAHHADDQAETILMRLGRGSGIGGLAGMRRETPLAPGLVIVRPLLGLPKADLVAFCRAESQPFLEDPSNTNPAFARTRLRRQAAVLDALGLDRAALLRLARRMARADEALEAEAARVEAQLAPERGPALYRADLSQVRRAQPEILLRLLRRAIEGVAPNGGFLRLDRLEALTLSVARALREKCAHRATLGGTRLVLGDDASLRVTAEPARRRGRSPTNGPITKADRHPDGPH